MKFRKYLEVGKIDGLPSIVFWRGSWWRWCEGRYSLLSASDVQAELVNYCNTHLCKLRRGDISNFLLQLEAQAAISSTAEPPCWLGEPVRDWSATDTIACRNQIVNLACLTSGGEFEIAATPKLFSPAALDFDVDRLAPRPSAWLRFLQQLWPNDVESVLCLQEIAGYLLTQDTSLQKAFLLHGPPRSGKGTIGRVFAQLIGASNVASPSLSDLAARFGLWDLLGKTVAIISDARLSPRVSRTAILEKLLRITGEDLVTIDRKFERLITTKLLVRFVILSNELPALFDVSGAIASRFIILRLQESWLGREDVTLGQQFSAELPGIMLWAAEGWRRLRARGHFIEPASASELRDELDRVTSPVRAFVSDWCLVGPHLSVARRDLYAAYRAWCAEHGSKIVDDSQFGRDLRAVIPGLGGSHPRSPRSGADRQRFYLGVSLRSNCSEAVAQDTGCATA